MPYNTEDGESTAGCKICGIITHLWLADIWCRTSPARPHILLFLTDPFPSSWGMFICSSPLSSRLFLSYPLLSSFILTRSLYRYYNVENSSLGTCKKCCPIPSVLLARPPPSPSATSISALRVVYVSTGVYASALVYFSF